MSYEQIARQYTKESVSDQSKTVYEDYKKIKKFEDVGHFLTDYVVDGGVVVKDPLRNDTINVSDIVVSINNNVLNREGHSFATSIPNAIYYLDFTKDGDWHWGTSHVGVAAEDYIPVSVVTTNASGLVNSINDARGHVGGFRLKDEYGLEDYAKQQYVDEQLADIEKVISYKDKQTLLYAECYRKLRKQESVVLCAMGDSETYGQDNTSADRRPPDPNPTPSGAYHTQTRASVTYPEAMQEYLNKIYNNKVTVINRGFSGDGTKLAFEHWTAPAGSDLTIINLGINDSRASWISYAGNLQVFLKYYRKLIERELDWNSAVIILTPLKLRASAEINVSTFANALYALGEEYGIPVIETDEFLANCDVGVYSDDTHLNGVGYRIYGARVAALFVGEGAHKPRHVSGGSKVLTRPQLDNIVLYKGAFTTTTPGAYTPAETTVGQGIVARLDVVGASVSFSIFVETEDLLCVPVIYLAPNVSVKVELDFDTQKHTDYSLDKVIYKTPASYTEKPSSSFILTTAGTQLNLDSTVINLSDTNRYLHIATRGWHTITITMLSTTGGASIINGLEFLEYKTMKALSDSSKKGYYELLTHSSHTDSTDVKSSNINIDDLLNALRLNPSTPFWKGQACSLVIHNYQQSVKKYTFTLANPAENFAWILSPDSQTFKLTETPTLERTCTGISYNIDTRMLTFNWGGATTRASEVMITLL